MRTEDMRLDGNAAAGTLREVFAHEMTTALATCTGCGTACAVGGLLDYGGVMGVILRCPVCDTAMLRVVSTPGWLHVDPSGIAMLMIPERGTVS
ncbi:MAG TPA: DUF6510 family protein [Gemmatimonadaceae bacterium]|nr:DUF6510 family protein [Gemmatimonadaceae bacterium]